MKIIAIAGEPGTGKSSIMKSMVTKEMKAFQWGLVRGHAEGRTLIVGTYEEGQTYPGTDRLSMAVQPDFIDMLKRCKEFDVVMYEGDRLSNFSLLQVFKDLGLTVDVFVLRVEESVLNARRAARKDTFKPTWLKGRKSKVLNFQVEAERLFGVNYLENNTYEDFQTNVSKLSSAAYSQLF